MWKPSKDVDHMVRLAALFVVGFLSVAGLRGILMPEGFGELGFFRSGAIGDAAALPIGFAGRHACVECHDAEPEDLAAGAHASVGCESCHWALADHVDDPFEVSTEPPDADGLCLACHRHLEARPHDFPQIVPADHAEADCLDCHESHRPEM